MDYLDGFTHSKNLDVSVWKKDYIWNLENQTSETQLSSILVLCTVYCQFGPNFARALLNKRLYRCQARNFDRPADEENFALKRCEARI